MQSLGEELVSQRISLHLRILVMPGSPPALLQWERYVVTWWHTQTHTQCHGKFHVHLKHHRYACWFCPVWIIKGWRWGRWNSEKCWLCMASVLLAPEMNFIPFAVFSSSLSYFVFGLSWCLLKYFTRSLEVFHSHLTLMV